jgi:hypothetical protein
MALFEYGRPARFQETGVKDGYELVVASLHWRALQLATKSDAEIAEWIAQAAEPGVYAFEAWIDSQGTRSIIYIGSSKRTVKERLGDVRSSLGLIGLFLKDHFEPWSDVSDVTIRWATLDVNYIEDVESALIAAHSPAFNSKHARPGQLKPSVERLIIMNAGKKGRLLPTVAGAYYTSNATLWAAPPLSE